MQITLTVTVELDHNGEVDAIIETAGDQPTMFTHAVLLNVAQCLIANTLAGVLGTDVPQDSFPMSRAKMPTHD